MTLTLHDKLSRYLPAPAVDRTAALILRYRVKIRVSPSRYTKRGDYRPPQNGSGHLITINYDLNRYAFLITLLHEIAHLVTHVRYPRARYPHGREWKHEFRNILQEFMSPEIFPEDVLTALRNHVQDPAASSCTDPVMSRVLSRYDCLPEGMTLLEELVEGTIFELENGFVFVKGKKLRKRFECREATSGRIYFVDPLARVRPR